jgi:hypothetical protein
VIPTRRALLPIVVDGRVVGDMPFDLSILCLACKHKTGNLQCEAFPDLIPAEIHTGRFDHREPFPGDHGIRYERAPGVIDPFA